MEFKDRLFEARRRKGFSQEDLANACLVSRQAVSKWENGTSKPDSGNLMLISRCLDVSIDELLGNEVLKEEKEFNQFLNVKTTYEYKSKRTIFGVPLVHIHFNRVNAYFLGRKCCVAKGIIAIGDRSIGVISIGFLSAGLFSLGILSAGILSLAIFSLGFFAAGILSFGIITFGIISVGVFSVGILSYGAQVSAGVIAYGKYAVGIQGDAQQFFILLDNEVAEWCIYPNDGKALIKEVFGSLSMPGIIRWVIYSIRC